MAKARQTELSQGAIEIAGTCAHCGSRMALDTHGQWECGACFCNEALEDALAIDMLGYDVWEAGCEVPADYFNMTEGS